MAREEESKLRQIEAHALIYLSKIALGKFPWIRQKEQKNFPWQLT